MTGIMMILSPAKTMNSEPIDTENRTETRRYTNERKTVKLIEILKSKSITQLKSMMKLSDNLAKHVRECYNEMPSDPSSGEGAKPAVYSFDGPAYRAIKADELSDVALEYMDSYLRVVDALYGLLKPLDTIYPYRLEMACRPILKDLEVKNKTLSSYWKADMTKHIIEDMKELSCDILANLASDEYSDTMDGAKLEKEGIRFVKISFYEDDKMIAVHAKRARGLMVRYMSEKQVSTLEEVTKFNIEGYSHKPEKSEDGLIVFSRPKKKAEAENDEKQDEKRMPTGKKTPKTKRQKQ